MKCQKCGKNETSFHYSSNINGAVTEAHLCMECAKESGYDFPRMFGSENFMSGMFPSGMLRGFLPMPILGYGMMNPARQWGIQGLSSGECGCGACEASENHCDAKEVDESMNKRRELNIIKEQMRQAAEKENFEEAAKLRDQIRQMEA